jgi:hypothetical protein
MRELLAEIQLRAGAIHSLAPTTGFSALLTFSA